MADKTLYWTKDLTRRNPVHGGGKLRCSGRVRSSCIASGVRCVTLVKIFELLWKRKGQDCFNDKLNIFVISFDHIDSVTVNEVIMTTKNNSFRSEDINLTTGNPWFSSFHVNINTPTKKSWYVIQAVGYRMTWKIILHVQVLMECSYIKIVVYYENLLVSSYDVKGYSKQNSFRIKRTI